MRKRLVLFGFSAMCLSGAAVAASVPLKLHIDAQPLDQALIAWATQTGLQVMIPAEREMFAQNAPALEGTYTPEAAIKSLLADSDFGYVFVNARTVAVHARSPASGRSEALAQADLPTGSSQAADSERRDQVALGKDSLQEVVVTAQKRQERLQDVPVPVTSVNATKLTDTNQLRLEDYYTTIPNLSVTPGDEHGSPQLAIRGITTGGFTNPTVGVVIDDIPFGATLSSAYGMEAPDVDPSDLASVEVLRGPQGTLYGASSMGGLLKFVTLEPSTDELGGRVQASLNGVRNGDEPAYGIRGSVNVPLSDTFAVRASGSTRRDAGYVDNARNGERAVNSGDAYGGRLSSLWRPSDEFDVKLSALVQRSKTDGSPSVKLQPGLEDLQQDNVPGTGWRDLKIEAYGATLTARFGTAEVTALSGYSVNTVSDSYDLSYSYGGFAEQFFGVSGAPLPEDVKTRKFTQEIRLATPLGTHFDWLIGGFFNDESSSVNETVLAADATTGSVVGVVGNFDLGTSKYTEYAAFTDLTWKPTTQFDLQLGVREGRNRTTIAEQVYTGVMFGPDPLVIDAAHAKGDSLTYLITPRLKLSPDLMMYVRAASGYRPGGPSGALSPGLPTTYDPDKTQNVEFGIKGNLFDNTFSYDASVYYITWKDIQIQLRDPELGGVYFTNGGRGKSQGVELSLESRPLKNLKIALAASYNDAKLTEDFPAESTGIGASGDRLPNSSRFSGSLSIEQSLQLRSDITAFFGGTLSYVGDRLSTFASIFSPDVPRQRFPAYARTDLRAGLEYDTWGLNLFLNNAWDRRGILAGGAGSLDPNAFYFIQPRTFGMSVTKTF